MEAKYFKVESYEMGASVTGKRTSNYSCYFAIYNADKAEIKGHPLSDVYAGRWPKCNSVINNWYRKAEKAKLERIF